MTSPDQNVSSLHLRGLEHHSDVSPKYVIRDDCLANNGAFDRAKALRVARDTPKARRGQVAVGHAVNKHVRHDGGLDKIQLHSGTSSKAAPSPSESVSRKVPPRNCETVPVESDHSNEADYISNACAALEV